MKIKICIVAFLFSVSSLFAQVELLERENSVYEFLKKMDLKGVISGFNSAKIPLSRYEIARFLISANSNLKGIKTGKILLNKNDRALLEDYLTEFDFDIKHSDSKPISELKEPQPQDESSANNEAGNFHEREMSKTVSGFNEIGLKINSYRNYNTNFPTSVIYSRPHYIYSYNDSDASFFLNITGDNYQRNFQADSLGKSKFNAGTIGIQFRGTLFNRLGYYFKYSNGKTFIGDKTDKEIVLNNDGFFRTAVNLRNDGRWFDKTEGYLRFESPDKWVSIMAGKLAIAEGFGYINKLYVSNFSNPFPYLKLDFKYKALEYSFLYGNINTDSSGVNLAQNKMISMHRLDVKFLDWLRAGFWEAVVTASTGFSFVHLNPLAFITSGGMSADVNTSQQNNSLLGFDAEIKPVKNVSVQGTLLVDDINFSTLGNDDYTANDNKFGYQAGVMWNDAFTLPGLLGTFEYTRLDPFVFTHRENRQQYTLWGEPLGHALPPNTDEKAMKFTYSILPRLRVMFQAQFQRSGEGFTYDSLGHIDINYGGDINHGERFAATIKNTFLQGFRVNRNYYTIGVYFEPIRFCYIDFRFTYKFQNLIYASKKLNDRLFYLNLSVKI